MICGRKYKVEAAKKGAYKGRGQPPEWRIVSRRKEHIDLARGAEDCWARIFSWLREHNLQRNKAGKRNRRGDQAATKNEDYGRDKEEGDGTMQNWHKQLVCWWTAGWWLIKNTWLHPEWKDMMQQWQSSLVAWNNGWRTKERRRASAAGRQNDIQRRRCRITKPTAWRGGSQVVEKLESHV